MKLETPLDMIFRLKDQIRAILDENHDKIGINLKDTEVIPSIKIIEDPSYIEVKENMGLYMNNELVHSPYLISVYTNKVIKKRNTSNKYEVYRPIPIKDYLILDIDVDKIFIYKCDNYHICIFLNKYYTLNTHSDRINVVLFTNLIEDTKEYLQLKFLQEV